VLPIHNFNEVATNGDLNYLKINREDHVKESELQIVWLNILDEYFALSKNVKAISALKKKYSIILMNYKLEVLNALKICLDKGINIDKELSLCKTDKVRLSAHIGMLKNDISRISNSLPIEDNRQENSDFDRTLAVIMKYGYKINRFKTTVSELIAIKQLIEEQNKAEKNHG
jgi:hypothetical protein